MITVLMTVANDEVMMIMMGCQLSKETRDGMIAVATCKMALMTIMGFSDDWLDDLDDVESNVMIVNRLT